MYQQGNDSLNGGDQDAAWSTRPPRLEAAEAPRRRRSRSRSDEPTQAVQAPAEQTPPVQHAPAGGQGQSNAVHPQGYMNNSYPQEPPAGYGEPGYAPRNGYGGYPQPGYAQQGGFAAPAGGYAPPYQQGYAPQNGYGMPPQGGYAAPGGYGMPIQNGYADPGAYNAAPQGGYADPNAYNAAPQGGYADPGAYNAAPQGGYADPNVYNAAPQGGYADPNAYNAAPQGGYADPNAYNAAPQGGYADPNAYTAAPQGGYADPNAYNTVPQGGYAEPGAYDPTRQGYIPPAYPPDELPDPDNPENAADKTANLKELLRKNAPQLAIILLVLGALALWAAFGRGGSGTPGGQNGPGSTGSPAVTAGQSGSSQNQTGTAPGRNNVNAYADLFLPNVYVDGICLTDMTYEEGSAAVWAQVNQKQNNWYVRLKNENGSSKDITAGMLGISFDPTSALQQAWAVGHPLTADGQMDPKALQQAVALALTTEYHFTSAQQSADTTPIDTILDTLQTNAYRAPQDAVILSFNPDDFVNPFTFQEEVWGQWLDVSAVKQEILNLVSTMQSGEVLLQTTPIAPNVTVADLQKTVTLRCRAVTPISSSSTEERTNNIRVAFSKINGKSLAHGDRFSFNKLVGRRTLENGFYEAIEYAYGEEVMGIGGGVCQASTTVYLAAVQSGMTITSRDAHSNPVNYTSLGMDATVSDTKGREVDFAFKNESGGRVFIAAHVVESGSNRRSLLCEVRIYGPALENIHYKLESETVEIIPKPEEPRLKEDKTGEKAFYVDETKLASKGRKGYVVDTYLCTYQDDILIGRDKISTDTYPARQDVMWVGIHSR